MLSKTQRQKSKDTENKVLNGLKKLKFATKRELSTELNMPISTVGDTLERLNNQDLVIKVLFKEGVSKKGRPKAKWQIK